MQACCLSAFSYPCPTHAYGAPRLLSFPLAPACSWGENEVLTSDMLVGTLFSLGTRVSGPTVSCPCMPLLLPLSRAAFLVWMPLLPLPLSRLDPAA